MTLKNFKKLTIDQQAKLVKECGCYLSIRESRDFLIDLYILNGIFVELWYSPNSMGINQIRSFVGTNNLDPYLTKIDISEVIIS